MLPLLIATALAAPLTVDPEVVLPARWGVQGGLLTGVDRWTGGASVVAEGRLAGWTTAPVGAWDLDVGYAGVAERVAGLDTPWLDAHRLEAHARAPGRTRPGVSLVGSGGLLIDPAWGAVEIAGTVGRRVGSQSWLEGRAGVEARGGAGASGVGAVARGRWVREGPTGSRTAGGRLSVYGGGLPDLAVDTWVGGRRPWRRVALDGSTGLRWVLGDGEPVAGLTAPGTAVTWLTGGLDLPLSGATSLILSASGELGWGARPYARGRVLLGLTGRARLRTELPPSSLWTVPTTARFTLIAPSAADVCLITSADGWVPHPMSRHDGGRWSAELSLPPGELEYAYLVDGTPLAPPEAVRVRDDGFGGTNGVIHVVYRGECEERTVGESDREVPCTTIAPDEAPTP